MIIDPDKITFLLITSYCRSLDTPSLKKLFVIKELLKDRVFLLYE